MCFGPVASFAASAVLGSTGTLVVKNVREKKEIFFATFPILFAAQQFSEGLLWLLLRQGKSGVLLHAVTFIFLLFAYSLWPVLCPVSVYAIEYHPERKRILRFLTLLGAATSLYLLFFIVTQPVDAEVVNRCLHYETYVRAAPWFTVVYVLVTLLPYFISSHKSILIFGIPNLIFCAITYIFYRNHFISVWCFFAAILSLTLYVFLRKLHHQPLLSGGRRGS